MTCSVLAQLHGSVRFCSNGFAACGFLYGTKSLRETLWSPAVDTGRRGLCVGPSGDVAQRPDLTESQRTTLWRAADCLHVGWVKGWTSMPQRPGDGVAYLVKCYVPPADADGWARCVDQAELFARMLGEAATYLRSFKASVDGIQPLTGWLETCCQCLSCGAYDLRVGAAGSGTQDLSRSDSIEMA